MNRLEVIEATTHYVSEPHKVLALDGVRLDVLLDSARPDRNLLGLVPTLLDWLSDPKERELVWQRILPPVGSSAIAPVLMCPDELDLWCTVVVAEVAPDASVIWWRRIGLDASKPENMPHSVGAAVDWIGALGPYCFGRAEYESCLAAFKRPGAEPSAADVTMNVNPPLPDEGRLNG